MIKDYYEVLGVPRDASPEQIKRAYRKLAMKYHPDVADTADAADKFKEIGEAYEVLHDANKRAMYDRGVDPMASGGFNGAQGFGFPGGAAGFDFTNLVDAMFGQAGGRGPRSRVRRGQDALVRLTLTLAEAAFGVTKPVRVETAVICRTCNGAGAQSGSEPVTCSTCHGRGDITQVQRSFLGDIRTTQPCPVCRGYGTVIPNPCAECSGEGRVRSQRTINVKIPAGVNAGNRIHLESQGEVGPGGGPAGDLYVELSIEPHETFTRNGDDLEMVVKLPMTAAALGTDVLLPTLEAERDDLDDDLAQVRLNVPSGTQSGTRIPIAGRGVPRLRGTGRGDLGVTLLVQTPGKLDDHQRSLLRQLAEARGEDGPEVAVEKQHKGVFGWLKDAFTQ
ncbi:MAG: molecular chaperone DnaJ [Micropruina sp.]|nr:molecular chaperone DnaJ [Micropruina sp.]